MANTGAARFAITGVLAVGHTLQADIRAGDPDGNGAFSYRWQASSNGSTWAPVGSNSSTYRITTADQGRQLRLQVTYRDGQGFSEAVTTSTAKVAAPLPSITLSLSQATIAEDGPGTLLYTFTRTGPTSAPLTVIYSVGGTATPGSDYRGIAATPTLRRVTFRAGSSTTTVAVDPTSDSRVESPETVSLRLSAGSSYSIGTPSEVMGTIRNSPTIQGRFTSRGESATYPVDVVTGSILRVSLTSPQPSLFPLLELRSFDRRVIRGSIAYNGSSADLGMVDLVTGKAQLHVRTQAGATGAYTLNISVQTRNEIKNEVFNLTNEQRKKAGLAPLLRNNLLEKAAQAHADDMDANNRYLVHGGSNGSSPVDRIRATGYKAAWVDRGHGSFRTISVENAATGQSSAAEVMRDWMKSSVHRAAILDPATKEIGIGFDVDRETGATYWLQNFGHPWAAGMKPWF